MKNLLAIVEGDGDLQAVPSLLQRLAHAHNIYDLKLLPTQKRGEFPKIKLNFDAFFRAALKERAPIIWIMDYDCEQCQNAQADLDELARRAQQLRPNWPIRFVFLIKEYESLFLADPEATRKVLPLIPADKSFPDAPEGVRDAKGWLSKALPSGHAYKPTVHQKKITAQLNFDHLRQHSPSFQLLEKAFLALMREQTVCPP